MILWLALFLAANVYGASIPTQPVIPTASACLQGCFESGSIVNAAFDLLNFKSIAIDIENFCSLNTALLKCGRECPAEQINELEARTHASAFICSDKVEEFRLVSGCLDGATDATSKCAAECGVPTDIPFRLDSSPAASVNPTVFLDGVAGTCKKHICMLVCTQRSLNKECAGAGDLFKDVARHQVRSGIETLTTMSADENATTLHFMAENYLKNLPAECAFLKDIDEFEKVLEPQVSSTHTTVEHTTEVPIVTTEETKTLGKEVLVEGTVTVEPIMEVSTPAVLEETPTETPQETSSSKDVDTTRQPVLDEGSVLKSEDETTTQGTTPVTELHDEVTITIGTPVEETTKLAVEVTEAEMKPEVTKVDVGVVVNGVDETTPTATEPVIVVDDTVSDFGENSVQAGPKQEVKTSSSSLLVLSTVLAAGATLLLI